MIELRHALAGHKEAENYVSNKKNKKLYVTTKLSMVELTINIARSQNAAHSIFHWLSSCFTQKTVWSFIRVWIVWFKKKKVFSQFQFWVLSQLKIWVLLLFEVFVTIWVLNIQVMYKTQIFSADLLNFNLNFWRHYNVW